MLLDKEQVARIASDVQRARITINHLSQELVDHLCCEVELLMEQGSSFEEAYELMRRQAGIEVLQQVQENTMLLTDQAYRQLRLLIRLLGNVSLALIAFAIPACTLQLYGATALLVSGFALLGLLFFPLSMYLSYTYSTNRRPWLQLPALAGGIAFMSGILFKIMYWQGASVLLLSGAAFLLCIYLPALLVARWRSLPGSERWIWLSGIAAAEVFGMATVFKLMHWPGTAPLLTCGAVLLISIFLPLYGYTLVRKEQLSPRYIFLVTISMYVIVMTLLISSGRPALPGHEPIPRTFTLPAPAAYTPCRNTAADELYRQAFTPFFTHHH